MISQIFVSPDSLEDINDFTSINSLLNDIKNDPIFLVDFTTVNWVKYIRREYIDKGYDLSKRDIIIRKLVSLDKAKKIFKKDNHSLKITNDSDWLKVLELSNSSTPLNLIVAGKSYIDTYKDKFSEQVENINNIVISPEKWNNVKLTDNEVTKTPLSYRNSFGEILKNSKKLKIIDPYIGKSFSDRTNTLHSNDKNIIKLFSNLLAENRTGKGFIEIHTILDELLNINGYNYVMEIEEREEKIAEVYRDNNLHTKRSYWITMINDLANEFGHKYKVYFWSDKQYNSTFHDRYIFTDIIGVSPSHSVSASEESNQNTLWKVLNKTDWEKQESKYDIDDYPYFIKSCEHIEVGYDD